MSDDAINNVAEELETVETDVTEIDNISEEEVNETYGKDKVNAMKKHDDEDTSDEEKEKEEKVQKESAPKVSVPKTKAGVIQAAVDMLKAARKEDAQKMFSKMALGDAEDASVKSAEDGMKKVPNAADPKAKAKVEAMDFDEDLENIISEEATLSDGFRDKAQSIFEAVLTSKLTSEIDRLESEYAQNLEEEVTEVQESLVEKVDSYLNYVVESWVEDNKVAVTNGLRTEIAEDFMTSLQSVFKEHYIEVPEGKVDLVDELNESVTELESALNKTTDDNIALHTKVQNFEKQEVVREQSSGLAQTDAEKLASLVEDIEFDNRDNFEMKVKTVKDSYFKGEVNESVDEVDSLLGDGTITEEVNNSDSMARYTQAITNFNN